MFVGNGSLLGTRLIAMSNPLRAEVGGIVEQMTNFELSVAPGYMDNYTGSQFLPHTEAKTLFPEAYGRLEEAKAAIKAARNRCGRAGGAPADPENMVRQRTTQGRGSSPPFFARGKN